MVLLNSVTFHDQGHRGTRELATISRDGHRLQCFDTVACATAVRKLSHCNILLLQFESFSRKKRYYSPHIDSRSIHVGYI